MKEAVTQYCNIKAILKLGFDPGLLLAFYENIISKYSPKFNVFVVVHLAVALRDLLSCFDISEQKIVLKGLSHLKVQSNEFFKFKFDKLAETIAFFTIYLFYSSYTHTCRKSANRGHQCVKACFKHGNLNTSIDPLYSL